MINKYNFNKTIRYQDDFLIKKNIVDFYYKPKYFGFGWTLNPNKYTIQGLIWKEIKFNNQRKKKPKYKK